MNPLGFDIPRLDRRTGTDIERLITHRPLQRVLAFVGRSIDDLVNDPIVKNQVYGYYKLQRQVERVSEVVDLERWWNGNTL